MTRLGRTVLVVEVDDKGDEAQGLAPDGLDAEVWPLGASQIAATTALRERLATQKGEGSTSPPAPAGSGPGA